MFQYRFCTNSSFLCWRLDCQSQQSKAHLAYLFPRRPTPAGSQQVFLPLSGHLRFCERGSRANRKHDRLLFPPWYDQVFVILDITLCGFFQKDSHLGINMISVPEAEPQYLFSQITHREERMCRLLKTFSCIVNRDTCRALEGPPSTVWDQINGGGPVVPDFFNCITNYS